MPLVETVTVLSPEDAREVSELARAAARADGVHPLSEHVELALRHPAAGKARHLLVREAQQLVAYAYVDGGDHPTAELVVHPAHRRQGHGRLLLRTLLAAVPTDGQLRVWAHGALPAALQLAEREGLRPTRELLQMRRPLELPLAPVPPPEHVRLRAFVPGADDEAWVRVNAAAFAAHPEQGRLTLADLHTREAEEWFDPAGFLLAERAGDLLGFAWTKVERDRPGELYVLGVAPQARGLGLARHLATAALQHLQDRGTEQAMLYVDADNAPALRLYETLGFTRHATDVMLVG